MPTEQEIEAVLDEFNFGDGVVNAGDRDAERMAAEIASLRAVLVFADGCVLANNLKYGEYNFVLADLYAEDCEWAQAVIERAHCHARGKYVESDSTDSGANDDATKRGIGAK